MRNTLSLKLVALLALMIFGCSSDSDSGGGNPLGLLIKKITKTTYEDGETQTIVGDLHYSGSVLESLTSGNSRIEFVYSGNKVMQTLHFSNDVLTRTNTYEYDGDKLTYVTSNDGERIHYTYAGNTLSGAAYQLFDEDAWTNFETDAYVFSQNNLVQNTQTNFSVGTYESRTTYAVDDKNNPTINMNPYLRMTLNVPGIHLMSNNNATSALVFSPSSSTTPTSGYVYEMVYNAENYPTSIVMKEGSEVISETIIEYQ